MRNNLQKLHKVTTLKPSLCPKWHLYLGWLLYLGIFLVLINSLEMRWSDFSLTPFFATFGALSAWRYLWALNHNFRSFIYDSLLFPKLRAQADAEFTTTGPVPLFILVTSYKMDTQNNLQVYKRLVEECIAYTAPTTIIACLTDLGDKDFIENLFTQLAPPAQISLVVMLQAGTGKRDAMAAGLRAISRRQPSAESVVVLMDGDTVVDSNCFARLTPFFNTNPDIGALTVDNRAIVDGTTLAKEFYEVRLAQRHMLMNSMSLSKRLLVLTGRFSVFRSEIAMHSDFINAVENDTIEHWRFGKIKLLTGDDKSTWFWVIKNGWKMLYIPDVCVYCLEKLPNPKFFDSCLVLMSRWYGNMLRTNTRAIKLGPKKLGLFFWWALCDQRISMWTSLIGPVFAIISGTFISHTITISYLAWVMASRAIQALGSFPYRKRLSPYSPFILYFIQVFGSLIKVYMLYHLDKQSWTRQGIRMIRPPTLLQRFKNIETAMLTVLASVVFVFGVALYSRYLTFPDSMSVKTFLAHDLVGEIKTGSDIQNLIDACESSCKIELPARKIILKKPLTIEKSFVTIIGQGPEKTVITAKFAGENIGVIQIGKNLNALVQGKSQTSVAIPEDSSLLPFAPNLILKSPKYFSIKYPNDKKFLRSIGSERWDRAYPFLRQTLAAVKQQRRDALEVEFPVGFKFPVGTTIMATALVENVDLQNFSIEYALPGVPDPLQYENLQPQAMVDGIKVESAARPKIKNIHVINIGRHALNFDQVYAPTIENIIAQGSWNKGEGGNGYFRVARTAFGQFNNIRLQGLRHLTIQWSSHHNEFKNLNIDCDVNFHGGFAHHNKILSGSIVPRLGHKWSPISTTPRDAHWAPPDGAGNEVAQTVVRR